MTGLLGSLRNLKFLQASKLETAFSMVSCLFTNTRVVCRQWNILTHGIQKEGFQQTSHARGRHTVELRDDATYPITNLRFISFHMSSSAVLELNHFLYVPGLTRNVLLVSTMTNLKCVTKFDDKKVIVIDCSYKDVRVLAKGVREGSLYRLLADPMKHDALVHDYNKLREIWHKIFGHLLCGSVKN
jgi:hypothetical protein